jgi:NitT/TauT family transport system substrate-binding protein
MMRKLSVAVLCLALLLAIGCSKDPTPADTVEPPAETAELHHVIAVGSSWYGHIPVWIGIENRIFEQQGFEVEWRTISKSIDRLNAISSGNAQFASLGEIAMLGAMAQGNTRFYWVGSQDTAPGFEGLVTVPEITSYEQLRGKEIGFPFGSSVDLTCRMLLKQNGLDPEKDVELVNLEVADVPSTFLTGGVDGALIWEPGFSKLLEVEGANILGMDTDTEVYKKFGTMSGPDVLIISKEWVDADTERARKFMTAYFKALSFVRDNPDKATEIVQGKYIQQDLELIRANMKKFIWHDLESQHKVMSEEGIYGQAKYVARILHEDMGKIPVQPDFMKWVNMDILSVDEIE